MSVLNVEWPAGPEYSEWVGVDGVGAWVGYKLKSANFFIDILERVGSEHDFMRIIGVEMSLDAALAALCGAFDASVGGIFVAADAYFGDQPRDEEPEWKPVEPHEYAWWRCRDLILPRLGNEELKFDIAGLESEVETALRRDEGEPLGWLMELQRLRNMTLHQNSLARHIDIGVGTAGVVGNEWSLTVGARKLKDGTQIAGRAEHPVSYLREAHTRLTLLTSRLVALADHLAPHGFPMHRPTQSVNVHGVAARARVDSPPTLDAATTGPEARDVTK